ncbi:MAG TPA: hypothetical protein VEC14_08745 [Reyranellaceae bacterium]|nr:hypothetical protein [Reyranellaceae bacterium]
MFVDRDGNGTVTAAYAGRQRPGQEELADAHPDLDALLRPALVRSYRELRAIDYRDELGKETSDYTKTFGDVLDTLIAQVESMRAAASAAATPAYGEMLLKIAAIKARHPKPEE